MSPYFEGCSTNSNGYIFIHPDIHDSSTAFLHQAVTFVIDAPKPSNRFLPCSDDGIDDLTYITCMTLSLKGIFVNATELRDVECIKKAISQSDTSGVDKVELFMLRISEVQLVHSMTGYVNRIDVEDYHSVEHVDDEMQAIMGDELMGDSEVDDSWVHPFDFYSDDAMDVYDIYGEPFKLFEDQWDEDDDYYYDLDLDDGSRYVLKHGRHNDLYDDADDVRAPFEDDSQDLLVDYIADDDIYWY